MPKTTRKEVVDMEGYTLFIMSDNSMYINEEPVNLETLQERLKAIAPEVEERGLILKADESVRYGLVVEVMDIAKQSGIVKLIVATRRKDET